MAGAPDDAEVPRAGEPIHLPAPSYLPVVVSAGITIAVVGVVLNWIVLVIGLVITVVGTVRWVGDTRRDISELPLSHDH